MNLINQTLLTLCQQCQVEPKPLKSRKDFSHLLKVVFEKINSDPSYLSNDQMINTVKVLDDLTHETHIVHKWLEKAFVFRRGSVFTIFVRGEPLYFSKNDLESVSDFVKGMAKFKQADHITFDDREKEEVEIPLKLCLEDREIPESTSIQLLWRCFDTAQYLGLGKALNVLAQKLVRRCFLERVAISDDQMKLLLPHLKYLDLSHCPHITHAALSSLKGAPIEELNISHNGLMEQSFSIIGTFKHLKKLDLSDSPFFWYLSFKHLMGLSQLTELNLSGGNQIKDGKSYGQLAALPKLKKLILKDSCKLPEEVLHTLQAKPDLELVFK